MDRVRVTSSNIRAVGYDSTTQILEIEFIESGVYQYMNVPKKMHERFMAAASKGRFFSANIKDKFRTRKVR